MTTLLLPSTSGKGKYEKPISDGSNVTKSEQTIKHEKGKPIAKESGTTTTTAAAAAQPVPVSSSPYSSVSPTVKRIIISGCDLLIPGSFLGWIPASSLQVGLATTVSTLVPLGDIWVSAQRQ